MGKKEVAKYHSFCSVSNIIGAFFFFLGRKTHSFTAKIYLTSTSKRGFTLIELVLVIAIFAIISTFSIAALNPIEQYKKAQDARRKSDLSQVQRALEAYYQDHGKYPSNTSDFKILDGTTTYSWGASWKPYMDVVPKDPSSNKTYIYYTLEEDVQKQSYFLYASLDRKEKDPQACNQGNKCPNVPEGVTCGDICNYGVSSSNASP